MTLNGCGHIVVRPKPKTRVRCRLCERIFTELQEESDRQRRKAERRRKKELQWIKHQIKKQRQPTIRIRLSRHGRADTADHRRVKAHAGNHDRGERRSRLKPKSKRKIVATVSKVVTGHGVILIPSSRLKGGRSKVD
jgi:hypothetical protein